MLAVGLAIAGLVTVGVASPATAAPPRVIEAQASGTITTGSLTNAAGTRSYQTYSPRRAQPNRPLFVWLHGASKVDEGDPQDLRRTSTLLLEADRRGYSVVAPMQSLRVDPAGTWQPQNPNNEMRGRGEPSIIADIVRRAIRDLHADPARVYIVGHSAGGATTQTVAALYSELFAGVATSAGIPYLADPTGLAIRVARRGRPLPTFIVQGTKDSVTPPVLGQIGLSAAMNSNGIAGSRPWSSTTVPASQTDPYRTVLTRYGHGRTEVDYAEVVGAEHWTGPGGVTVNGRALDRRLIDFLLSKHR
ncbi:alpha/beta hydrolase family esterase [Gordonia neofelifaecis]|uniref:PHB depolymerase family esterase n=1 Tax=Gordonia neofelifaecis NRRL B-59395 TaxID=644548 RepID=F1YLA6_9ACTN|nr:PHB depolymerase family esterase [Gordonia neofelifaecis]EGD54566.1 PHB depolymerase family esterase [Gordonia neofelifaecis NRRL B-59395]